MLDIRNSIETANEAAFKKHQAKLAFTLTEVANAEAIIQKLIEKSSYCVSPIKIWFYG